MPWSSMRTISPGSISRTYSASIASNAHVSLATHQCPSRVLPSTSGRMPHGSRHGFDAIGEQEQQAERALQMLAARAAADRLVHVRRLGQQVNDDLGVGRALENVPVLLVLPPEQLRVDQVAVVRHRDRAHRDTAAAAAGRCTACWSRSSNSGRARSPRGRPALRAACAG